jgi:large subunit ribosomal protein L15
LAKVVKVIKSRDLSKAVKLNGIGATAGAKAAIEAAGGSDCLSRSIEGEDICGN